MGTKRELDESPSPIRRSVSFTKMQRPNPPKETPPSLSPQLVRRQSQAGSEQRSQTSHQSTQSPQKHVITIDPAPIADTKASALSNHDLLSNFQNSTKMVVSRLVETSKRAEDLKNRYDNVKTVNSVLKGENEGLKLEATATSDEMMKLKAQLAGAKGTIQAQAQIIEVAKGVICTGELPWKAFVKSIDELETFEAGDETIKLQGRDI